MKEYRKKNRGRLNEYLRMYLKRSRRNYNKTVNGKVYEYTGNNKLDYPLLDDSGKGRKFELLALSVLRGSTDCNKEKFTGKQYDIKWKNRKIDVKMKNLSKEGKWGFTISKGRLTDDFLLFCCIEDVPQKTLLIPRNSLSLKTKAISVGLESKYDKFSLQTTTSL